MMTVELRVKIGEDDLENLLEGRGGLFPDLVTEIRLAIQNFVSEEIEVGYRDVEVKIERGAFVPIHNIDSRVPKPILNRGCGEVG
jgi:hypothetical protein